jgi:putative methylase
MEKMITKSKLAIILSKLNSFCKPKVRDEQYITDSEIAAEVLWNAYNLNDIDRKVIADFGAGTGILGIGALILGAKEIYFVDSDKNALEIAKNNLNLIKSEFNIRGKTKFIYNNINDFEGKTDVVIQNPPFGIKNKHADKVFLEKAFKIAKIIYSLHKSETKRFVRAISNDYGFDISHVWNYEMPLKASYVFHKKRIKRIKVSWFRLKRETK